MKELKKDFLKSFFKFIFNQILFFKIILQNYFSKLFFKIIF